jgi:L-ascorbate metabolism protein UlaG (beta-lactamase superfamily)
MALECFSINAAQLPDSCCACHHRRPVPAPALNRGVVPRLDFVVISHNHYDHLDRSTVVKLHKEYGDDLTWYGSKLMRLPRLASNHFSLLANQSLFT